MARLSYLTLALVMVAFGGCTGGTAGSDDTAGTTGIAGTTGTDTTGTDSDGDTESGGDDTPEATALPIEILGPPAPWWRSASTSRTTSPTPREPRSR